MLAALRAEDAELRAVETDLRARRALAETRAVARHVDALGRGETDRESAALRRQAQAVLGDEAARAFDRDLGQAHAHPDAMDPIIAAAPADVRPRLKADKARLLAERAEDPAGAAARAPEIAELYEAAAVDPQQLEAAIDAAIDRQADLGIPEEDRRPLPLPQARAIAAEIQVRPAAERPATLREVLLQAGDHRMAVLGQVVEAGLSPEIRLIAAADATAAPSLAAAVEASQVELARGLDPEAATEVRDRIASIAPGLDQDVETIDPAGTDDPTRMADDGPVPRAVLDLLRELLGISEAAAADPNAGLSGRQISRFLADWLDPDKPGFRAAAEEAGMDPDTAELFRDIVTADGKEERGLTRRILAEFDTRRGRPGLASLLRQATEQVLQSPDPRARLRFLETYFVEANVAALDPSKALAEGLVSGGPAKLPRPGRRPRPGKSGGRHVPKMRSMAGPTDPSLFDSDEAFEAHLEILRKRVPLGMGARPKVAAMARDLIAELRAQGALSARLAIRGSSITGRKFDPRTRTYAGKVFNSESDYDFAIVSPELLERLRRAGVSLMGRGARTGVIRRDELKSEFGLDAVFERIGQDVDLDFSIVVYRSPDDLARRGPAMWLD